MDRRGLLGMLAAGLGTAAVAGRARAADGTAMPGASGKTHRLVLHVDRDDPVGMRFAIGFAHNAATYFASRGERIEMEIVANAFGVNMLSHDSPVKARLAVLRRKLPQVTLSACGNSIKMVRRDGKDFTLLDGARVVPAGIARLVELQEEGWSYVKP